MKRLLFLLFLIPSLLFAQKPPVSPPQVGSGSTGDAGKFLKMDANGRGTLGTISGSDVSGNISGNAANVTGIIAPANGGSGVSTITGYIKGNGTSSYSASATIPATDLTGLSNLTWMVGGNAVSGASVIGNTTNHALIFRTNNTERLQITAAGNVGINTAYFNARLNIGGNLSVGDGYQGYNAPTNGAIIEGSVGIGTNSPSAKLTVAGGIRATVINTGASTDNVLTTDASGNINQRTISDVTKVTTAGAATDSYITTNGTGIPRVTSAFKMQSNQEMSTAQSASFGQMQTRINEISNVFWKADKRFTLEGKANWRMFDGDFSEQAANIVSGDSIVIEMPSTTYIQGGVYVNYYYTATPSNPPTMEIVAGGNRYTYTATDISFDPTYKLHKFMMFNNYNYLTRVVIKFTSSCTVNEICYISESSSGIGTQEPPLFSKLSAVNNFYGITNYNLTGSQINHALNGQGGAYFGLQTGNLGVGLSNASYKLTVKANSNNSAFSLAQDNDATTGWNFHANSSTGGLGIKRLSAGGENEVITIFPSGILRANGFSLGNDAGRNRIQSGYSSGQKFRYLNASDSYEGIGVRSITVGNSYTDNNAAPADGMIVQGYVGIGTTAPGSKLEVNGSIHQNAEDNGIFLDASGSSRLGFVKKSGSAPVLAAGSATPIRIGHWSTGDMIGNIASGSFSEKLRINTSGNISIGNTSDSYKLDVTGTGSFSSTVIVANATADNHAVNRQTGDGRYGQLGAANTWTATNTFSGTNTTPSVKIGNTQSIYSSSALQTTIDNNASNGDIVVDKQTGQISSRRNYVRYDYAYGNNNQQNHNISFVDGTDTAAMQVTDTTRTIRIYKSTAITTSKVKITLPQFLTHIHRITVLCETDPTSIKFFTYSAAQPIITTANFPTVGVGDVFELWFAYNDGTGNANSGKWYIKKL